MNTKTNNYEKRILATKFFLDFHVPLADKAEQAKLGKVIDYKTAQAVLATRGVPEVYTRDLNKAVEIRLETRSWKEPRMYVLG